MFILFFGMIAGALIMLVGVALGASLERSSREDP